MYYYWFEILKDLDKNLMITADNSIQNSGIKNLFFKFISSGTKFHRTDLS